ncbi:MAG: TonB-dependent receptor [Opitutaceae bacterium]|nr:TonB-dependent receptor [Opitutaceae bacterium]
MNQVEVFRGPHASVYGSSSLAGLVNVRSNDPESVSSGKLRLSAGNDDMRTIEFSATGPLLEEDPGKLTWRLSALKHDSDGFRENVYLNRDDTNGKDELLIRGKLRWLPQPDLSFDLTLIHGDMDNGYDAWSPLNGLTMYSDRPGKDSEEVFGSSIRTSWRGNDAFELLSITSYVDIDLQHSYDGDWGNNDFWAAEPYNWDSAAEGYDYDFFDNLLRNRQTISQEFRLISSTEVDTGTKQASWVVGLYYKDLEESDDYNGWSLLQSDYDARNLAVYGEKVVPLSDRSAFSLSLRVEDQKTSYSDDQGVAFSLSETMVGGRALIDYQWSEEINLFTSASRGFKSGGFNQDAGLPEDRRGYDAEYLWNFEGGLRGSFLGGTLATNVTAFYMLREDMQISTSFQDDPLNPSSFLFYTTNAASGTNYGVEAEVNWSVSSRLSLFANLGLLETKFDSYETAGGTNALEGREQPHAPNYSYFAGFQFTDPDGFFLRGEITGKDDFYFSDSHDQQSSAYSLVNSRIGYRFDRWVITLWGRNLFDEEYDVRGFYFGLEPPNYSSTLYRHIGDPRQFGVTLEFDF